MELVTLINKKVYFSVIFFITSLSYSQSYVRFNTLKEAAENFAEEYNGSSIANEEEIGTRLYEDENNKFYYGEIFNDHLKKEVYIPNDPAAYADIHTHGAYDEYRYSNVFSGADIRENIENKQHGFMVGPAGQLDFFEYEPQQDYGDVSSWNASTPTSEFEGYVDADISDKDLPHDENDPEYYDKDCEYDEEH